MKKLKREKYSWFIEPLDSYTNGVIARELSGENFEREILCGDKVKRNLWRCASYDIIAKLLRRKNDINVKFNIFVREGGGKIRRFFL